MAKSKVPKNDLEETKKYIIFLKKMLDSKNYKSSVTEEEYNKTKAKYDKAKLRIKLGS